VLLCGMETPPTRGWDYTLDFHAIYPELARKHDVPLMPFLLTDVVGRAELNLEDGWHPNAAGARIIADNVWRHLEPLLR
jgi:acyl-CoA thioesterase-1